MSTTEYTMRLTDYLSIARCHKYQFIVPFVLIVCSATALAFLLPPTYRSEATLLIQRQTIPQDLVATTVNAYVQEQIEQIRQQLLAYNAIVDLARGFDSYSEALEADAGAVVRKIREGIEVEMLEVEASDPNRSGQRVATIAFTIAFSAETPELARDVTAELAQRYQDIHYEARTKLATDVTGFLDDEAQRLSEEIQELEKQLASFKQEEMHQLPELMSMNLSLYERTEKEIEQIRERIRDIEDRINVAAAEISLTTPYAAVRSEDGEYMLSATERLSSLTAEYLRATARYSPAHPDVIRLSREIRVLAEQAGNSARADELMSELVSLQEQLRQAQQRYSQSHPEVQRLERSIGAVQSGFRTALIDVETNERKLPPDNPRYVALETQLQGLRSSLSAERERFRVQTEKLAQYEERLFQTPVVERDFKTLSRDYDNALSKYNELRDKQLGAELSEQVEAGGQAEKFVLASPAYLPSTPESPNRLGIALLGVLFGFAGGIGMLAIAEHNDDTIRSARNVAQILGIPPLAIIPEM